MTDTTRESRWKPTAVPPDALRDRIRDRMAITGVSGVQTRTRVIASLVAVPLLTALVVWIVSEWVYRRQAVGLDVDAAQASRLMWTLLFLLGTTAVSTWIATWRGKHGFGAGAMSLAIVAALVAPIYALLTLASPLHGPGTVVTGVEISPWGVRCALIAAVVGVAAIASFAAALRRAVPVASRLRGAAVGAAAGAWAGLAVFVFCPSGDLQHLLAGHLLPVIVLTLAGALATPWLLRP